MRSFLVAGCLATTLCHCATIVQRGPKCSDVTIPVSIKAKNLAIPATLNATTLQSFINGLASSGIDLLTNTIDVEGTYTIAARFCEPERVIKSRSNTLQLLVHGITQTRNYWSSLAEPGAGTDTYSWIAYASQQGYPTLSIDRLGSGLSSHPDGLTIVQIPAQVETIHSLIGTLRNTSTIGSRSFSKIVYVGHSFGSELGNAHSANYEADVDAYVLCGYTPFINNGVPSTGILTQPGPAALVLPERFGNLPPTYLATTNQDGTNRAFFFVPTIDTELLAVSYATRGTVTIGELVTTTFSPSTVAQYHGDIFVLTGQQDTIFCAEGLLGAGTVVSKVGDCKSGAQSLVSAVKRQYPNARSYDQFVPDRTGHGTILQYGAQEQFERVHAWLRSRGY